MKHAGLSKNKPIFKLLREKARELTHLVNRYLRPSSAAEDGNFDSDESWEAANGPGLSTTPIGGKTNIGKQRRFRG